MFVYVFTAYSQLHPRQASHIFSLGMLPAEKIGIDEV